MRKSYCSALFAIVLNVFSTTCLAQIVSPVADQGPPVLNAGHNFLQTHSLNETINPAVGSVSLKITAPVPDDRGETTEFAFEYDSNSAHHGQNWFGNASYLGAGGWSYTVPSLSVTRSMGSFRPGFNLKTSGAGGTPEGCNYFTGYNMTDLAGTMHPLGLTVLEQQSDCWAIYYPNMNEYLTGGDATVAAVTTTQMSMTSGIQPVTVSDGNGTVYTFATPGHQYPGDNSFSTSEWISVPPPFTGVANLIEDRNGNQINISDAGNGNIAVTDTLGRRALTINGFGKVGSTTSVTVPGLNAYQVTWVNQEFKATWNVEGIPPSYAPTSSNPMVTCLFAGQRTNTTTTVPNTVDAYQPEVSQITLPNGQTYKFTYDFQAGTGTGLLKQVTYPDGAVVVYSWTTNPMSSEEGFAASDGTGACEAIFDTPALSRKVVMFDGHTPALQQDYTYTPTHWVATSEGYQTWTAKQTTVVTTDVLRGTSYKTVYNYVPLGAPSLGNGNVFEAMTGAGPNNPTESSVLYYGDLGQTLLKTVTKSYWDYWAYPSDVKTTLDNGQTSEAQSCYLGVNNSYAGYPAGSLCPANPSPVAFLSASLLTDSYQFDYGAATGSASSPGAVGSLQSHTHVDYNTFATPLYPSMATILGRAQDVKTYDGNGNEVAETDYAYDGNPVTQVSAIQHDENVYAANVPVCTQSNCPTNPPAPYHRGNVTSKTARCFVGSLTSACTQGDSITQYAWYETGQMASKTDANGYTTRYSYVDSFATDDASNEGAPTAATNAYLTSITDALGHTSSFQYAYTDGALRQITGQNVGEVTHYYYKDTTTGIEDPLRRFKESDDPDGGQTLVSYNDTPYPPTIVTKKKLDNSRFVTTTATADGMGHVYKTQLNSDPSGIDETDSVFDGFARPYSVTNPFRSTSDSTYGTTVTQYDGLGRVTSLTRQDGGVVTTSYTGTQTTVTDEAGNQRRTISDALGRLIEVDEPGDPQPATPATATLNITGNSLKSSTTAATSATATIAIASVNPCRQFQVGAQNPQTVCDQGTVWATINGGHQISAGYVTTNSSPNLNTIASNLASAINSDSVAHSIVTATASSNIVTVTANTGGASCCNYATTAGSISSYNNSGAAIYFNPPGISAGSSGGLAGGTNSSTTYDYGNLTVSVGSWTSSQVPYGQGGTNGGNNTNSQVMGALNTALNASSSPVTAHILGGSIQLTEKTPGSAANGTPVTVNSTSSNSSLFGNGSFAGGATMLGGGWNGGSTLVVPYVTLYKYDTLGNLLCVEQHGDASGGTGCSSYPTPTTNDPWRPRMFSYNSLSQLLSAYNPETGNIAYSYDANGNVLTKTDARGAVITYSYDALNRLKGKTFSTGDPAIGFTYDYGTNGIGHRTGMTDGSGSTAWSYDIMGHVLSETRTINPGSGLNPVMKTVSYQYLFGRVTQITYPDGTQINYAADNAGRDLSAIDGTHSINYVTNAAYGPSGGIASFTEQAGNTITNAVLYNPRLQICREVASTTGVVPQSCTDTTHNGNVKDFLYDFHLGNHDNGSLYTAANNRDPSRTQTFTYDSLKRLLTATTQGTLDSSGHMNCSIMTPGSGTQTKYWGESFTYDAWANLTGKGTTLCSAENTPLAVNAQNKLVSDTYDVAGNVIGSGGTTFAYNGESQLTSSTSGYSYIYDGDGNRIEKSNGSTGILFWYGAPGIMLETDLLGNPQSEYVFFGGQRVARRDLNNISTPVYYYFANQIHSTALITDANGTVEDDADYYPWGGMLQFSSAVTNNYWFSGKFRDTETGLDYFGARYYSSVEGRFRKPDWSATVQGIPYADFGDPQSLNLYTYVRNLPTSSIDVDGHAGMAIALSFAGGSEFADAVVAVLSKAGPIGLAGGAVIAASTALIVNTTNAHAANQEDKITMAAASSMNAGILHNQKTAAATKGQTTTGQGTGVEPYETGQYGDLSKKSKTGDGLALDHQPSHASNVAREEAKLGRKLTPAEAKAVKNQGMAVAVPNDSHVAASPTYGGRNNQEQIQADAANPQAAAARDSEAMVNAASPPNKAAAQAAADKINQNAGTL